MGEKSQPCSPQDEEATSGVPAAVDWMNQQAAASQPVEALPALPAEVPMPALSPGLAAATLAAREKRIADALRGNDRLTEGLPPAAADDLMNWGLDLARSVVDDTAGLNDSEAENVLQPRVRAVRRLMMAAAQATDPAIEVDPAEWLKQVSVALGDRYTPGDKAREATLRQQWQALSGHPQEQIATLRQFIEQIRRSGS